MRGLNAACCIALLALGSAAAAAPPPPAAPPPADPGGAIVSELVVQAREPGPAWWRVEGKGSVVYILGLPDGAVPRGIAWDRSVLRRLTGANAVIGPPGFTAGLGDLFGVLRLRAELKSKGPMEASLPQPLAQRYAAAMARTGRRPGEWSGWQPMAAGAFLLRASRDHWQSIEPQVRGVARRQGLRVTSSARYPALPLARAAMAGMTPAVQQQCLGWALDDVEAGEAPARRAAEGWARGDVAVALTEPRGFDRCLLVLTGGAELWNRMARDEADDIAAALGKPGHAVALVGLRRLLAQNGVVARLEAKGLTVKGPGEP
ncbi:MAG TPA: TraB/GumN family protein [Phenylobacterium sp.]|uniref:TraB/GumN family protein n=1 Tax=Phenylobacterium sp. TaxID=1871053 RepID=UPI002D34E1A8|nr:TraB/GumN family protein [Phenylobacterium sp.]HZZ70056.1 TraB/GumN family protein [Phenylobacterium sp.]